MLPTQLSKPPKKLPTPLLLMPRRPVTPNLLLLPKPQMLPLMLLPRKMRIIMLWPQRRKQRPMMLLTKGRRMHNGKENLRRTVKTSSLRTLKTAWSPIFTMQGSKMVNILLFTPKKKEWHA